MKVLVCGGRDYQDRDKVFQVLDVLHDMGKGDKLMRFRPISFIIHGNASGADDLADEWAVARGVQPVRVPALWGYYGKRAGPLRNFNMSLLKPDKVIAFPGGAGTQSMISVAKAAGIPVFEVGVDDDKYGL